MKIERIEIERTTIEDFADKHDLIMEVRERALPNNSRMRYYAYFKHSETKEGCILSGTYGNGHTPEAAIENYAHELEHKLLVINSMSYNRREIEVPRLI